MKPTIFKRATALLLVTAMVLIAIPCFPLTINAVDNITDVNQMGCLGQTYNMLGDAIIGKGDGTKNIFVNLDSVTAQFFPYKSSESKYTYITSLSEYFLKYGASLNASFGMGYSIEGKLSYKMIEMELSEKYHMDLSGSLLWQGSTNTGKQTEYLLFEHHVETGTYQLWLNNEDQIKDALNSINPSFYNDLRNSLISPEKLFADYGTHIITAYKGGATAVLTSSGELSSCESTKGLEANVAFSSVKDGLLDFSFGAEIAGNLNAEKKENSSIKVADAFAIGGEAGLLVDYTNASEWGKSVNRTNDIPLVDENLRLLPIWNLLLGHEYEARRTELEEYFIRNVNSQYAALYSDYIYNVDAESLYEGYITISTPKEFNTLLRADLDGNYVLINDIDLSSFENWTPIGTKAEPFRGTLCGNGNTVTGMNVTACADGLAGLFGANDGIIRNLAVEGKVDVDATASPNNVAYIGGIVGYNTGRIMNCKSEVTVNGKMVADAVGGGVSEASDGLFGLTGDKAAALQAEIDNAIATATKKTGSCTVGDAPIKLTGTVSNATITIAASTKPAYIVLENVTFTGVIKNQNDIARDVYIISIGTKNTVKGSADTSPFNVAKANLYVTGDAPLTVTGGDRSAQSTAGATGLDGVVAVNAKMLYIDAKEMSIVGGNGGNGGNGKAGSNGSPGAKGSGESSTNQKGNPGGNGGNGAAGGQGGGGGQGAAAVNSAVLVTVYNGDVILRSGSGGNGGNGGIGGNGGNGGEGANGNPGGFLGAGFWHGGNGGRGGNGGAGGSGGNGGQYGAFASSKQLVLQGTATVTQKLGTYGNGGRGGNGGTGGRGGDRADCRESAGLSKCTPGGNGGSGGNGGAAGKGGNGLSAGTAGTPGAYGLQGAKGSNYNGCGCSKSNGNNILSPGSTSSAGSTLTYTGTLAILKTSTTEYEANNTYLTWEEANKRLTNGATLVSIGSASEQAHIEKLVKATGTEIYYWIGLQRKSNITGSMADLNTYVWSDGTMIQVSGMGKDAVIKELDAYGNIIGDAYANWDAGEPNNDSSAEPYGVFYGYDSENNPFGTWNDSNKTQKFGFITEKRTASSTNTLDASALFTGGICGFNAEGGTIENVYNKGNINRSEAVGGESERFGIRSDESGVTAYAGGIAGYNDGAADAIKGTKNTGNVCAYAESGSAIQYADAYAYGIANRASSYYTTGKVSAAARSANNLKTVVSDADDDGLEIPPAEIGKNWPDDHEFRLESVKKTTYFVNHKFDPTTVKLTFDGKDVSLACDVRFNFYTPGHTNVTLIYKADGKQYTRLLPVYVQESSPVSISLNEEKSAYFKDTYLKGETFSTQGLIFTLTYDNGETVNIPFNSDIFRIDAPNMNLVGEQTLNVVYVADELSPLGCTVTVSVDSIRTERIQIAQEPHKTSYYPKEMLDWNGMVIQRIMNDGSIENIDIAKEYANGKLKFDYVFKSEGEAVVTVIYDTVYTAEFVCHVLSVAGSDLPRLEVANAAGSAGHTVQMTVYVKNNPGFGGMNLSYEYDKTVMTLTDVTCCQSVFNLAHNKVTVMDAAENWTEDGQLLVLTFELADNAPVGNYDVVIHVDEAYEYTASGLDVVDFHTVDGTVTVMELLYGDANSDGTVNTMDIMLLRRHLASRDPITGVSTTQVGVGADANGDGVLNTKDLVLIRKYVAAKDPITGESSVILGPAA